jgi:hypothetical protein
MRALILLLLIAVTARGACVKPVDVAVGPRSIQPQCSYWSADIAAAGPLVVGAWVTSMTTGFGQPYTTGTTAGGALDARGRLRAAEQTPLTGHPGYPSVATNGTTSLLAWGRTGWATFVQFLDAEGKPAGDAVKVSNHGAHAIPPRAVWTGSEWRVVLNETPDVVSLRIGPDGSVLERTVVATDSTLADADGALIVVVNAAGSYTLIAPNGRYPLPGIPARAAVAVDERLVAWSGSTAGAQRLGPDGAPLGMPIAFDSAPIDFPRVAVAGDVVLWGSSAGVRGVRVRSDGGPRILGTIDGTLLHAAATTSDGVVALVSGACSTVTSRLLAPGADTFAAPEIVARATVPPTPLSLLATARGHHAYWMEARPLEKSSVLFVTHVEGSVARPPAAVSTPLKSLGSTVDAAPLGDGSVVAWVEYTQGQAPATLHYARVDAEGRLRERARIGDSWFIFEIAVAVRGEEVTVFTLEHASYAWDGVLWKTTIAANGVVTREQLLTNVDAWDLDAATTAEGIVASWQDSAGTRRLHVRDAAATRIFPVPDPFRSQRIFGGATPLVLWQGRTDVHALFPASGVDVIAGKSETHLLLEALPLPDGSFDVAWAPFRPDATAITIVNVQPSGVVTPREELCFPAGAWFMTMRDRTVDALFTQQNGAAFVTRKGFPRRRAAR